MLVLLNHHVPAWSVQNSNVPSPFPAQTLDGVNSVLSNQLINNHELQP
jgi:hypothetical protein